MSSEPDSIASSLPYEGGAGVKLRSPSPNASWWSGPENLSTSARNEGRKAQKLALTGGVG